MRPREKNAQTEKPGKHEVRPRISLAGFFYTQNIFKTLPARRR